MLAKRVGELPPGDGWIFEPKWDGFRALVFRDGDEIFIQSRDEKPLDRYFPELIDPLKAQLPERCVLDGEIVIAARRRARLRGAAAAAASGGVAREEAGRSRCRRRWCSSTCSARAIATFSATRRFAERRAELESMLAGAEPPLHLTPATTRPRHRRRLVSSLRGRGARRRDGEAGSGAVRAEQARHAEGEARARLRLRRRRLSAGTRAARAPRVGSLLLGLYDDAGNLEHVGVCASFTDGETARARVVSRAVSRERARRIIRGAPGPSRRRGVGAASPAGRAESLECGEGSVVGAAASRSSSSRLRTTTCRASLPAHGAVPPLAQRQASRRLHVRPARGRAAAGARRSSTPTSPPWHETKPPLAPSG